MNSCINVHSVAELKALSVEGREDGDAAVVSGYYSPCDGGGKTMFYKKDCELPENGGTVHAPENGSGRWIWKGDCGCFELFGIFDSSRDADNAYDAMVKNPNISKIEAHSDLNFAKRHTNRRNNLTLDFNNYIVTTNHCEKAAKNDPFAATFAFRGVRENAGFDVVLTEKWRELTDIYYVEDSSRFAVYDWFRIRVNKLHGAAERELDKLISVSEIIDESHIRLNYKNAWELKVGRVVTFTKCDPVQNIKISNLKFHATAGDMYEGTHPIAFEFAVRCDIDHIYSQDNFWPLCIRRYNTHFLVEACELMNPCEVQYGGSGYLAQNLNCLYGCVRDCHVSNARHLNDFTASGYCMVENCHGDGDWCGVFVTHGQYEHDLTYIGCSGLISFANSGFTWGECAKRITVIRHSASRVIAKTRISELTLIDVQTYIRKEANDYRREAFEHDSGTIFVNCDGLQMRGCTAEGGLKLTNMSNRSRRRNIIDGCAITQPAFYDFKVHEHTPDIDRVDFINCDFYGCKESDIKGVIKAKCINTEFHKVKSQPEEDN